MCGPAASPASGPFGVPSDGEVVAALRSGDAEACELFIQTHAPRLVRVARRLLGQDQDAYDAVQDAFVSALRSLDGFDGRSRLSTWLHRIVVNAALMKLRARRRRTERSIDELLPDYYDDGHRIDPRAGWGETSEELLQRHETRAMLTEALGELPEEYRAVIVLRDVEELDTAQAARILGTTEGAAKTRLHRARQALRTLLEERLHSGGSRPT